MKKMISVTGIVAVCLLFAAGQHGIYSWFTDQSQQINSFTTGWNEVEIEEEFPDPEMIPGEAVKKEVAFTNTGAVPMYVRASLLFSSKEAQDNVTLLMGSNLWEKGEDGYYYYQKIVGPQEKTDLLLKGLEWNGQEKTEDFDLTVYTETIQAAEHANAREAFERMMRREKGEQA